MSGNSSSSSSSKKRKSDSNCPSEARDDSQGTQGGGSSTKMEQDGHRGDDNVPRKIENIVEGISAKNFKCKGNANINVASSSSTSVPVHELPGNAHIIHRTTGLVTDNAEIDGNVTIRTGDLAQQPADQEEGAADQVPPSPPEAAPGPAPAPGPPRQQNFVEDNVNFGALWNPERIHFFNDPNYPDDIQRVPEGP